MIRQDKASRSITCFLTFAFGCRQNCLLRGDEAERSVVKAAAVSGGSQMCCEGHTEVERLTSELYDLHNKFKNLFNVLASPCAVLGLQFTAALLWGYCLQWLFKHKAYMTAGLISPQLMAWKRTRRLPRNVQALSLFHTCDTERSSMHNLSLKR